MKIYFSELRLCEDLGPGEILNTSCISLERSPVSWMAAFDFCSNAGGELLNFRSLFCVISVTVFALFLLMVCRHWSHPWACNSISCIRWAIDRHGVWHFQFLEQMKLLVQTSRTFCKAWSPTIWRESGHLAELYKGPGIGYQVDKGKHQTKDLPSIPFACFHCVLVHFRWGSSQRPGMLCKRDCSADRAVSWNLARH